MRLIKFRLRDISNHIVGYEKWYEGSLNKETFLYTANPAWLYSADGERWRPAQIAHRNKDLFTGLHDKNGEEIYEGDIVRAASEGVWRTVEVRWRQEGNPQWILWPAYHDGKFWYLNGATKQPDGTYKEMCEVIGNIYENPELINEKTPA